HPERPLPHRRVVRAVLRTTTPRGPVRRAPSHLVANARSFIRWPLARPPRSWSAGSGPRIAARTLPAPVHRGGSPDTGKEREAMASDRMARYREAAERTAEEQRRIQERLERKERERKPAKRGKNNGAVQAGPRPEPELPFPAQHLEKPGSEA